MTALIGTAAALRSALLGGGFDLPAAEGLALAASVGSPTLRARAHIVRALVLAGDDPGALYSVSFATSWAAIPRSNVNPADGLRELVRALERHERTAMPIGIMRGLLRDFLPALCHVGLHRLVAALDVHLPPAAYVRPAEARTAVDQACELLGPAAVAHARAEGHQLGVAQGVALLGQEVEAALRLVVQRG